MSSSVLSRKSAAMRAGSACAHISCNSGHGYLLFQQQDISSGLRPGLRGVRYSHLLVDRPWPLQGSPLLSFGVTILSSGLSCKLWQNCDGTRKIPLRQGVAGDAHALRGDLNGGTISGASTILARLPLTSSSQLGNSTPLAPILLIRQRLFKGVTIRKQQICPIISTTSFS